MYGVDRLATIDHGTTIGQEATALRRAAERDLTARVPGCPAWSAADLVRHVGEVHDVWAWVLASGAADEAAMQGYEAPVRPSEAELITWAGERTSLLLAALEAVDPDEPRWNWSGRDQTAGWIARRMLHETVIHRWDAESATGTPGPIARELAADGIDEYLRVFAASSGDYHGPSGYLGLTTTDTGLGWTLEFVPPAVRLARPWDSELAEQADRAEVYGASAEELLLLLWERTDRAVFGPLGRALLDHVRRG
jgi:uncharacterized protein (TIGR03083 family)